MNLAGKEHFWGINKMNCNYLFFHSFFNLVTSSQNVVHLHTRTLLVAISLLVDDGVNSVLLQAVPDINKVLLQQQNLFLLFLSCKLHDT